MKKYIIAAGAALVLSFSAAAQNFQRYNLGYSDIPHYNPAAEANDGSDIYVLSKYNFLKVRDPENFTFQEDPLDIAVGGAYGSKWGYVSMEISHDAYSYYDRHYLRAGYAYVWNVDKIKAPEKHRKIAAAGGVSLGVDNVDWSKFYVVKDGYKPAPSRTSFCVPDMYLSMEYTDNHIRTGITGVNLISYTNAFDGRRNPRLVLIHFSYSWRLGKEGAWGIMPYFTCGYCERSTMEIGLSLDWHKYIGIAYAFRAMDMLNICNLSIGIPNCPLRIDMGCAIGAFNKERYASLGCRYVFD